MTTSLAVPGAVTTTTGAATTGSFADRINFNTLYGALSQRGVTLTDDEKHDLETITLQELRSHDGGQLIGSNLGASFTNLVYVLFSFIQNVVSGKHGGLADTLTASFENSGEQGKQHELELATQNIYTRLTQRGGNLAAAAELITGQTTVKPQAEHVAGNVYNQILDTLNRDKLRPDLSTNLNQTALASADPAHGLPAGATKPLTQPERSA